MAIVQVLKRKDGSSVIVAVSVALILAQFLPVITGRLTGVITNLDAGQYLSYSMPGAEWRSQYLAPLVSVLLQLLVLEVLIRAYVIVAAFFKKAK